MLRVLVCWPVHVPMYWTGCYHFTDLGEVAGCLAGLPDVDVTVLDGGALNLAWGDFAHELMRGYDAVVAFNQFDNLANLRRLAALAKAVRPDCRVLTYGPASAYVPGFFKGYPLDAIVTGGDWELVIGRYVEHVQGRLGREFLAGLLLRGADGQWSDTGPGPFLAPAAWGFPALDKLPLADYARVSGGRELSVTVARGCPLACRFCRAPRLHPGGDRRRPAAQVAGFLARHAAAFDYVSMYAPTFTADRGYVADLCRRLEREVPGLRWKCVTTVRHLDRDLVDLMRSAGCFRISLGVETLEPAAQRRLGKVTDPERVREAVGWCREAGIEPLAFLMVGLPGQTRAGVQDTVQRLLDWGATLRFTAYTPYDEANEAMSEAELEAFDRKTLAGRGVEGMPRAEFVRLAFNDPAALAALAPGFTAERVEDKSLLGARARDLRAGAERAGVPVTRPWA